MLRTGKTVWKPCKNRVVFVHFRVSFVRCPPSLVFDLAHWPPPLVPRSSPSSSHGPSTIPPRAARMAIDGATVFSGSADFVGKSRERNLDFLPGAQRGRCARRRARAMDRRVAHRGGKRWCAEAHPTWLRQRRRGTRWACPFGVASDSEERFSQPARPRPEHRSTGPIGRWIGRAALRQRKGGPARPSAPPCLCRRSRNGRAAWATGAR